jgi:hypothetical protein
MRIYLKRKKMDYGGSVQTEFLFGCLTLFIKNDLRNDDKLPRKNEPERLIPQQVLPSYLETQISTLPPRSPT